MINTKTTPVSRLTPWQAAELKMGSNFTGLEMIGYWRTVEAPGLPDPHDHIDLGADPERQEQIAKAIDAAPGLEQWCGWSTSRLTGEPVGSCCATIPGWAFPEGLSHYVRHGVVLEQDFVEDLLAWYATQDQGEEHHRPEGVRYYKPPPGYQPTPSKLAQPDEEWGL